MDEEFISLMKTSLPSYVVQCFLHAGFDTQSVIAQMDTSDGPNNSLDVIESFILKNYPQEIEPSCYHSGYHLSSNFVFSPGHRMRIVDFIKEVRSKFLLNNMGRKRKCNHETELVKKRAKSDSTSCQASHNASQSFDDDACTQSETQSPYNIQEIVDDVRSRIVKWQRKQHDKKILELKEHQHYKVSIKLNKQETPTVSVWCGLCRKTYKLHQKSDDIASFMISNWSGHIKNCVKMSCTKTGMQQSSIASFVSTQWPLSPINIASSSLDPSPICIDELEEDPRPIIKSTSETVRVTSSGKQSTIACEKDFLLTSLVGVNQERLH